LSAGCIDRETYYQAAADLWRRGCQGEILSPEDAGHFRRLARDRFYTFMLSVNHSKVQGEGVKVRSVVSGFVSDLQAAPGLEAAWRESEFASAEWGQLVEAMLAELREHD
jgi:hypothetical protein